jgi:NifB/MoaA-like Fe-S oxidoreductase
VTAGLSGQIVAAVRRWQRGFRAKLGTRFVFAADELYLASGRRLPGRPQYEGFPQLSNGIGGARLFLDSVRRIRPPSLRHPLRVTLVTGEMALPLVEQLAERLADGGSVSALAAAVRNGLLGRSVTTAGLLSGADIARALRSVDVGELVLVPAAAVREEEGFLDSMTLCDLSRRLGVPVVPAGTPAEASAAIRQYDRRRGRR